jgi:ubiquinone/menaquinone biosynthesis C-methylase UbiE
MEFLDKHNFFRNLDDLDTVILELGCGENKKHDDAIGIDAIDYECVDIVGDAYQVLKKIPDEKVTAVYSYHFFEHLTDFQLMIDELARIMKPNGSLLIVTPHFSNPHFYSDPTHRLFFGLYTFSYLCKEDLFKRRVPQYKNTLKFELSAVKLVFKSSRPFYFRWLFKKTLQFFFSFNYYMMEFYEENFCYLFPCYEVEYKLVKL